MLNTFRLQFRSITVESLQSQKQQTTRDEVFIMVNTDPRSNSQHHTTLEAKLDPGAQGNILPIRIYCRVYPQNQKADGFPKPRTLNRAHTVLTAYGGTRIKQYVTCSIQCEYKGHQTTATFFVIEVEGPEIKGLPTSLDIKLVTLNCALESTLICPLLPQEQMSLQSSSRQR